LGYQFRIYQKTRKIKLYVMSIFMKTLTASFLFSIFIFTSAFSQTTKSWDFGGATNDWEDPLNWSPNGVPGPSDFVELGSNTRSPGTTITINNSTSVAGLETWADNLVLNNQAQLTTGLYNSIQGKISGDGRVLVTDSLRISTMEIAASVVTEQNVRTVIENNFFILAGGVLELNGTTNWQGGNIRMEDGTQIINNGTLTNTGEDLLNSSSNSPVPRLINNGTINQVAGTFSNFVALDNTGQITVQSSLRVDNGGVSPGTFTVEEGALINFDGGGHDLQGADFFGGGTVEFGTGSPVLTGTYNLDPSTGKTLFTGGVTTFDAGMNLVSLGNVLEVNARSFAPELRLETSPDQSPEIIRLPNNGKLILSSGVTLNSKKMDFITGTFRGEGIISISDTVDWAGGRLGGNLVLSENAHLKMGGLGQLSRRFIEAKSRLEINGTAEWLALQIEMADSSTIINNGIWEITGSDLNNGFTTFGTLNKMGTIVNNGTIHHKENAATLTARVVIENNGFLIVESLLRMSGAFGTKAGGLRNQREGRIEGTGTIQFLNSNPATSLDDAFFENFGTVAPGLSAGTLNWSNKFTSGPGSVLEIELGGLREGEQNDLLISSSSVTLSSVLEIKFIDGFVPVVGQKFKIMTYGSREGLFDQIIAPVGFTFEENYVNNFDGEPDFLEIEVKKAIDNPIDDLVLIHPAVEHLGHSVAMGDFDGDGFDDLAITGLKNLQAIKNPENLDFYEESSTRFLDDFEADTIFVVLNARSIPSTAPFDLQSGADVKIAASGSGLETFGGGNGLLHTKDINGDNRDELFVGGLLEGTTLSGGVYLFDFSILPNEGVINETDAFIKLRASDAGITYPEVIKTGDISDNTFIDVIAGFPRASVGSTNTGVVAIWNNSSGGIQPPQYITTDLAGNHLGIGLDVGDVNGDGILDLGMIAGGELVENNLAKDIECIDPDGVSVNNYYSKLVDDSNPGKGVLKYGPISTGGNISSGFGDAVVNGQFRPNFTFFNQSFIHHESYATFNKTLMSDLDNDGRDEWYITESLPRSALRRVVIDRITLLGQCEDTDNNGFPSRDIVGKSIIHQFNFDKLDVGSVLDESDSFISFSDAGRSLIAAHLGGDDSKPDLVFAGDKGEINAFFEGTRDVVFVLNDFSPQENQVSHQYVTDLTLGTEDTRLIDLQINPFFTVSESMPPFLGFGQAMAAGNLGEDDISDLLIGSPYFIPENQSDAMGQVYLFRSDKPVNLPETDVVSGIDSTGRWQFLGSPSTGEPYNALLSNVWTQGATGASTTAGSPSVFTWNETVQQFEAVADLNQTTTNGQGFMAFLFEDDEPTVAGIQGGWPKLLVSEGDRKTGEASLPVTYTQGVDSTLNGFNLVSNPYNEAIDWEAPTGWTKTNINDAIYIWDGTANSGNGAYKQRVGGVGDQINVIVPLQGFFVQASDTGAVLTVREEAKTTGGSLLKAPGTDQLAVLNMNITTQGFEDKAYFVFRNEAKIYKDNLDAVQLKSLSEKRVQLFSLSADGKALAINSLPNNLDGVTEIPIHLESTESGEYILDWNLNNLPANWEFSLTDHETGITTDLKTTGSYSFQLTENSKAEEKSKNKLLIAKSNMPARFTLQIAAGTAVSTESVTGIPTDFSLNQNYPNPFNPSTNIDFGLPQTSDVRIIVYNLLGQQVMTLVDENLQAGFHTVRFDASALSSGIYLYQIQTESFRQTKKMILIK